MRKEVIKYNGKNYFSTETIKYIANTIVKTVNKETEKALFKLVGDGVVNYWDAKKKRESDIGLLKDFVTDFMSKINNINNDDNALKPTKPSQKEATLAFGMDIADMCKENGWDLDKVLADIDFVAKGL